MFAHSYICCTCTCTDTIRTYTQDMCKKHTVFTRGHASFKTSSEACPFFTTLHIKKKSQKNVKNTYCPHDRQNNVCLSVTQTLRHTDMHLLHKYIWVYTHHTHKYVYTHFKTRFETWCDKLCEVNALAKIHTCGFHQLVVANVPRL